MKVLVYLPSSLGAALLSIPCLKSLQANFPEAEIHLLLNPWLDRLFAAILPEYRRIALGEMNERYSSPEENCQPAKEDEL